MAFGRFESVACRRQHDGERLITGAVLVSRCCSTSICGDCASAAEILRDELGQLLRRSAGAPPHPVHDPQRQARLHEQQHREQGDVTQRDRQ